MLNPVLRPFCCCSRRPLCCIRCGDCADGLWDTTNITPIWWSYCYSVCGYWAPSLSGGTRPMPCALRVHNCTSYGSHANALRLGAMLLVSAWRPWPCFTPVSQSWITELAVRWIKPGTLPNLEHGLSYFGFCSAQLTPSKQAVSVCCWFVTPR